MIEINSADIVTSLAVVWILWVTGACTVITYGANKQRKSNNAAFAKIRELEKLIGDKK